MASSDKSERIKNIIDFVQTSRLVDTKQPIENLMSSVKTLSAMSGEGGTSDYVVAWERYVLVVPSAELEAKAPAGGDQK